MQLVPQVPPPACCLPPPPPLHSLSAVPPLPLLSVPRCRRCMVKGCKVGERCGALRPGQAGRHSEDARSSPQNKYKQARMTKLPTSLHPSPQSSCRPRSCWALPPGPAAGRRPAEGARLQQRGGQRWAEQIVWALTRQHDGILRWYAAVGAATILHSAAAGTSCTYLPTGHPGPLLPRPQLACHLPPCPLGMLHQDAMISVAVAGCS